MSNALQPLVKAVTWSDHHADLEGIRAEVFIQEQGISAADEWDGLDEHAVHFLAFSGGDAPVGCARLLVETAGGSNCYHIGRVAIRAAFRDRGIGHQLMLYVIQYCRAKDPKNTIYLHAQLERCGFYEALGFVATGEKFMEAGIPHITMYWAG